MTPERALWGAVLNQGIYDALWPRPWKPGSGAPTDLERSRAQAWLGGADFAEVCWLAGVEPSCIAPRVRRLLKAPADVRLRFIRIISDPTGARGRKPA